jgi:hypothetical protein
MEESRMRISSRLVSLGVILLDLGPKMKNVPRPLPVVYDIQDCHMILPLSEIPRVPLDAENAEKLSFMSRTRALQCLPNYYYHWCHMAVATRVARQEPAS